MFGDFDSSLLFTYLAAQFGGAFTEPLLPGLPINNILMKQRIKS
jgi:hypothetical protein